MLSRERIRNLEYSAKTAREARQRLEVRITRLECKHDDVVFTDHSGSPFWIGFAGSVHQPYEKECAVCGKVLESYTTKKEWLRAQYEEERAHQAEKMFSKRFKDKLQAERRAKGSLAGIAETPAEIQFSDALDRACEFIMNLVNKCPYDLRGTGPYKPCSELCVNRDKPTVVARCWRDYFLKRRGE